MSDNKNEPTFSILPHPAVRIMAPVLSSLCVFTIQRCLTQKTNEPPQSGGGLNNNENVAAFHATGPYVPNEEQLKSLGQPAVRNSITPVTLSCEANGLLFCRLVRS